MLIPLHSLVIPVYLIFTLSTFFGTLVFALEYDPLDVDSGGRLPDVTTAWWMLVVTMTTVGYGDYSPQTGSGRVLMGFAMIAGLAVFAMPLAIVGNNFSMAWEGRTIALIAEEIKRDLLRKGLSVNDVLDAFEGFDPNDDGVCSYEEFKRALKQLRITLHTKKLRAVWTMLDHDESGEVKYSEFAAALFPELEDDVLAALLATHEKMHSVGSADVEVLTNGPSVAHVGVSSHGEAKSLDGSLILRGSDRDPSARLDSVTDEPEGGEGSARLARIEEAMVQLALQQRGLQRSMDTVLALLRRDPPPPTVGAAARSEPPSVAKC